MRNVVTIVKKQLKDTLKNKTVLIQFVMFPVLTLIFEHAINIPDMPELFFAKLFSVMYMGMAPLTAVAAIISEEKEKNTLRVLMMANVKPWEYLMGVGIYVWTICMVLPVMLVFSFAPMLAMFNDKIEKIARIFYTQQIRVLLNNMTFDGIKPENFAIVAVNALLAIILFFAAFRKKGLE